MNIKFVTSDEVEFVVEENVAKMSKTIYNFLEDFKDEPFDESGRVIPLTNVDSWTLEKVIEYCNYHFEHPNAYEEIKKINSNEIIEWDKEFFSKIDDGTTKDHTGLFKLILAASYLDIGLLMDMSCKTVANMIKGKTPEEIRELFGIKNDFSPEEEEAIRRENAWCEEL